MNIPSLDNKLLVEIAHCYGTPVYVYNGDTIQSQIKKVQTAFSKFPCRIFYATKALSNINILRIIHQRGIGMDCVSINEIKLALHAGVPPEQILFTANSPSFDEVEEAVHVGVSIHIDTLSLLEAFGKRYGSQKPIGIRINPLLPPSGGTINISTAHAKSKFGIPYSQLPLLLKLVEKYHLRIIGLHQHTGSDVKDAKALLQSMEVLAELISHFPEVEYLDIGGGFKVPYYQNDTAIDIKKMGDNVAHIRQKIYEQHRRPLNIWFELGKYLVSQAGYLLATVNAIKETPQKQFAIINSGFHHLIRPMFYGAFHYIENLTSPLAEECVYDIAGILCETDTFAEQRAIPKLQQGDIVAIHNAGAYGFEMSSQFNSRLRPAEVLVENGKHRLIRKRELFEDLLNNQLVGERLSL